MIEIIFKKKSDLMEYDKNPRNNDEAVDVVASSIKEFGFKVPNVREYVSVSINP